METSEIMEEDIEETNRELGQGSYGRVFVGKWKGARVAVKSLHNIFFLSDHENEQIEALLAGFYREMKLLVTLRHPNVLHFLGYVRRADRPRQPLMITELLHESLEARFKRKPRMSDAGRYHVLLSVACGLRYLHERDEPIVHRDLASKNVLLSRDGYHVKIADYGLAKVVENQTSKKSTTMTTPGTELYAAPEVIAGAASRPSRDMFAYGVLALETILGFMTEPLPRMSEGNDLVLEVERRKEDLDRVPKDHPLLEMILRCLSKKVEDRPTAYDAVKNFPAYDENDVYHEEVIKTQPREKSVIWPSEHDRNSELDKG